MTAVVFKVNESGKGGKEKMKKKKKIKSRISRPKVTERKENRWWARKQNSPRETEGGGGMVKRDGVLSICKGGGESLEDTKHNLH